MKTLTEPRGSRQGWTLWLLVLIAALVFGTGCEQAQEDALEDVSLPDAEETAAPDDADEPGDAPTVAVARLMPAASVPDLSGLITFTQEDDGIQILADVQGVPREGEHGFHVHETGDCSAADFTSAGGHFAPEANPHAGPGDTPRHAGDLGNIEVDADGNGRLEIESDRLSLDPQSPGYVVGKAVILHEGRDDLTSQPTGDAGGRLACAVVELAELAAGFEEEEVEEFSEQAMDEMEEATEGS